VWGQLSESGRNTDSDRQAKKNYRKKKRKKKGLPREQNGRQKGSMALGDDFGRANEFTTTYLNNPAFVVPSAVKYVATAVLWYDG